MSLLVNDEATKSQNMIRRDLSLTTNYQINESFKEYKDRKADVIKQNLEILNEIPLNEEFRKALQKYMTEGLEKELDDDPLFEKSVEIKTYTSELNVKLHSYFSEVFTFYDDVIKDLHHDLLTLSKVFLNSDLPLSFIDVISESILSEIDYINIYTKQIRKERIKLIVNLRNKIKFNRLCAKHNFWIKEFEETRDKMESAKLKLIWYVDFNNCNDVKEIFKDKIVTTNRIDETILETFIGDLGKLVNQMEKLNLSLMDCSDFLTSEIDIGTKTILDMVTVHTNLQE